MIVQWDPGIKKSRPGWSDNHNFAKRALILVAVRRLMKTKPSQPGPDKSSQKLHGDQFLGGKWNHLIEFKTTHVKAWSIYSSVPPIRSSESQDVRRPRNELVDETIRSAFIDKYPWMQEWSYWTEGSERINKARKGETQYGSASEITTVQIKSLFQSANNLQLNSYCRCCMHMGNPVPA